jgi:competence protein ComEC
MTLGSRGLLTDDTARPFRRTGTAHILAISGLHIGALLLLLLSLTRNALCLLAPRHAASRGATRAAAPIVAAAVLLYVALLGAPLSALRSAIMVIALLGAAIVGRRPAPLLSLSLAALLLLLRDPATPLDPAFWLSAGATCAILLAWRKRPDALRGPERGPETRTRWWLRQLGSTLYTSAAAWIGVAPIQLALSGELPIAGLLLNPVVVPAVSVFAFPLIAVGALLAPIHPALATPPTAIGTATLQLLGALATHAADLPGATWTPGIPPWPAIALTAAAAATALATRSQRLTALMAALTLAIPAVTARWDAPPADTLRIHFIPVGQGDATLIESPDGQRVLIDAGGAMMGRDPGEHIVAPHLKRLGVSSLHAVILTHSDLDHMGGLTALAQHIPIKRFIYPADDPSPALRDLTALMAARGAALLPATADITLGPHLHLRRPPGAHGNDASLVLSARHGGLHALLAGDLEAAGERWLVGQGVDRADIIKMPHHGSRTSSTQPLIDAARPSVAVASAALHSRFGHPHPEVIDRYRRAGALTLRTDLHGLIRADLAPTGALRLYTQRPAGPIPLILPQIAHNLWKTCAAPDAHAAFKNH